MDLNALLSAHQIALIEMRDIEDPQARDWAGQCADAYAALIVTHRERIGVPARTFDYRELLAI